MRFRAILFTLAILSGTFGFAQATAPTAQDSKKTEPQATATNSQPTTTNNTSQPTTSNTQPAANNAAQPSNGQPNTEKAGDPEPTKEVAVSKDEYVIGPGDELSINVWKEPDLTKSVPVRPDGKITLPLVGDVQASGQTPHKLEEDLAKQMASFVASPSVTVIVLGAHSRKYNIMGEVVRPGTYEMSGAPSTVLDALALAGGLKDFAKSKKIYILRTNADGTQVRLPFNYKQVIKGENMSQNIRIQAGDTIVVP